MNENALEWPLTRRQVLTTGCAAGAGFLVGCGSTGHKAAGWTFVDDRKQTVRLSKVAALAGALGVIGARRARAQQDFNRDLAASRARIVRAGDEARRRFERDLHDGAQQRLVSLGLEVRHAEATVPPELGELQRVLSRLGAGLNEVLDDLRELSRGLHPAVPSEDGLEPALRSLALRSAVPVDVRINLGTVRFEESVEVAAYYVASEALTNTAKHAHASRAQVSVRHRDGWAEPTVSDDGRGGADASSGSGLTGLADRVEAIGGTIQIESPRDAGTAIHVKLPARRRSDDRLTTTPPRAGSEDMGKVTHEVRPV